MEYGRLGTYKPGRNRPDAPLKPVLYTDNNKNNNTYSYKVILKVLVFFAFGLICPVGCNQIPITTISSLAHSEYESSMIHHPHLTKAMSRVCGWTSYQNLFLNELMKFTGSSSASNKDMIHKPIFWSPETAA
ncbi:Pectinesterase, active site-containing protein [Artemisia annua]|uniref:Pectinesterase, active site-containing protein n=1 Tax=Artemisia annua TaxID=35608 RepID=A0A2U1PTV3_ARTAN|nr:Pectinesterase, active site-containing protein [Artemisia annua]